MSTSLPPTRGESRSKRRRKVVVCGALITVALVTVYLFSEGERIEPVPDTPIFQGIRYGCHALHGPGANGPVHWVQVDLTAPGIDLYVTPTDPALAGTGYSYRLRYTSKVARAEHLAVAVNASLFTKEPYLVPGYWPGQRANGVETVVSSGRASHLWEHTYLLWFDEQLTPTLERRKPPKADALSRARWAVGGQGVGLRDGRVTTDAGGASASRTAVGIDPERKLLVLAVFSAAEPRRALEELATLGARDGTLLDGGGSTSMVIGAEATGVRPGTVLGGGRPVATHFGVRARPLR